MKLVSLLFHDVFETAPSESGFCSAAADRYKLSVHEFESQLATLGNGDIVTPFLAHELRPDIRGIRPRHAAAPATAAPTSVALTFDDGGRSYISAIAPRLEALGWHGHCFVTTGCIGRSGFLSRLDIRQLDASGHLIGTHSVSHPTRFSALPPHEMHREWADSRRCLEDIVGHAVTTASVPGGYFSGAVARAAADAGLNVLFTSEPTSQLSSIEGCVVIGRFTIRRGDHSSMARRFVMAPPWARGAAWAAWNAKGLVKPLLGPSYARIADWLLSTEASGGRG